MGKQWGADLQEYQDPSSERSYRVNILVKWNPALYAWKDGKGLTHPGSKPSNLGYLGRVWPWNWFISEAEEASECTSGHKTQQVRKKKKKKRKEAGFLLPGEKVLFQISQVAHTPLRKKNVYKSWWLSPPTTLSLTSGWLPSMLALVLPTPASKKEAGYRGCSSWRLLTKKMTKPWGQGS